MRRRHATWTGHVAQLSYRASYINFGEVFPEAYNTLLRTLLRASNAFPQFPGLPPMVSAALRGFGFRLGFPLGFRPVTGAMCHPPMSKINASGRSPLPER